MATQKLTDMNRKHQSIFRAHRRGSGCLYMDNVTKSVQFCRKKGSTAAEWNLAQKNKIILPNG